jgi:hypothetical protein
MGQYLAAMAFAFPITATQTQAITFGCSGEQYDCVSGEREDTFPIGAEKFTVKEIEVFEIADQTALPAIARSARMGIYFKRSSETQADTFWRQPLRARSARTAHAGASGRQRVGKGGERMWRLFVVDELARAESARGRWDSNGDFGGGCSGGKETGGWSK